MMAGYQCNTRAASAISSTMASSPLGKTQPAVSGGSSTPPAKFMQRNTMRAGEPALSLSAMAKAPRKPPPPPTAAAQQAGRPSCTVIGGWQSCKWQVNYGQMGRLS